jgi:hypothetical protein
MAFSAELPIWLKDGTEPSESKKTEGWLVGEHPPADWFNWLFFNNYMALKEIQEKAVEKGVLAEFQEWATGLLEDFETRLNTVNRVNVTLNPGVNVLNAAKQAPFSLEGLAGAMRVNIMGRAGGCESIGAWSSNVALVSDTANKTSGLASFKLTLSTASAQASYTFLTTPGKKYAILADLKNGNTTKASVSVANSGKGNDVTSASVFSPSFMRFAATDFYHNVMITGTGASGNTFNMDSVRIYEISEEDYAAAASYTAAQAAAKWPYVDSVMPVRNPYAIRYGENLVPPFHEWTRGDRAKVLNPYKLETVATVSVDQSNVYVPVSPGKVYTFTAKVNGRVTVVEVDDLGAETTVYSTTDNENRDVTVTFTTKTTTKRVRVFATNTGAGTFTLENPMLNIGSIAKPFKPREDSMLALQTDLYADRVTGANADTVFERDGQYFKNKNWRGLTLDGNQPWTYFDTGTGYKGVRLVVTDGVTDSEIVTKYDGKLIPHAFPVSSADQSYLSASSTAFGLSISVADSGWADSYTPTTDDIKAYFFGYKAYDANTITPANAQTMTTATWSGTGTKYWVQRVGTPTFTQSAPQQSYAGYTPYQLVYQLATPTVEPIVSEGQLSFVEGDNQVEVGTGMIVREGSKPAPSGSPNVRYWINGSLNGLGKLTERPNKIIAIYKNGKNDSWEMVSHADVDKNTYGITQASITSAKFDPAASYSVTYLVLDNYPVVPFTGSYAANEKTLLADLVDGVQQNTARVSVLENKKADKDSPTWLTPTLLNGWANYGSNNTAIGYKKIGNLVVIKGVLKGGVYTRNAELFKLPPGYRPLERNIYPAYAGDVFAAVWVNGSGVVAIDIAQSNASLAISIVFEAEQ